MPKGWDRESVIANTRPVRPQRRNVTQAELTVPDGDGKLVLFAACCACGLIIAVLYGWFGLMFLTILLNLDSGAWFWWAILGLGITSSLALFAYAVWEREHDSDWLEHYG